MRGVHLFAVVIHVSHADVPTYCEDADEDAAIEAAAQATKKAPQPSPPPLSGRRAAKGTLRKLLRRRRRILVRQRRAAVATRGESEL